MSNYWQDRMAEEQNRLAARNQKQIEKQLQKYYGTAAKHVMKDFELTYEKILAQMEDGKQITPALLYKLDSYWQMQGQLRQVLNTLGEKQIALMTKQFELHFFDIYYSIGLEGFEAFNTLSTEAVNQMINGIWCADGKSFSQRIWQNTEILLETLNEELIQCVATGKTTSELKQKLQERLGVSYSNADMIARTELAHIQTEAAKKRYEDYGIKQVEIWADADERRCDVCGKLHQTKYLVGAAVPIPAHPRCRCCIVPVVED